MVLQKILKFKSEIHCASGGFEGGLESSPGPPSPGADDSFGWNEADSPSPPTAVKEKKKKSKKGSNDGGDDDSVSPNNISAIVLLRILGTLEKT